jgi:hypothetical protein
MVEERPQPPEALDLGVHPRPMGTEDVDERGTALLEHSADLGERETEVA